MGEATREQLAAMGRAARLLLCGDVMLGRGIDQILPHPGKPRLHEPYVTSAATYVDLAERANGPIPRRADPAYVWGDALEVLRRESPDLRIINLETSITDSEQPAAKSIHYKMSPDNVPCLTAAGVDCCVLANNHVLDWERAGLLETLEALDRAGIAVAGAGRGLAEARAPAVLRLPHGGRALVFAFGETGSGIPRSWAAGDGVPGINLLPDLSERSARRVADLVRAAKRPGDIAVASIHWGGNWGYRIPAAHAAFAHHLIDLAGIDLVHGHSSHHPKAIEIHRDRLVLYGCGDFLNDYEGIHGHEAYRGELVLMYLPALEPDSGRLVELRLTPFRIRRFRLVRATPADTAWLREMLARESAPFSTRVDAEADGTLSVSASRAPERPRC
ncbi:MAG: CapA family protein [Gammaproteobacteria bacterium]|nr:CapA family protein [Gammaproteobacteria bacterium]